MILQNLKKFKDKIKADDLFEHSAALAFYTILALGPIFLLTVFFISTLRLNLQQELLEQIKNVMGTEAASAFQTLIFSGASEHKIKKANILGFSTLGISASILFVHLQGLLNLIFGVSTDNKMTLQETITKRIFCFMMIIFFVVITIISLGLLTYISFILGESFKMLVQSINMIGNLAFYALIFSFLFHWMPDRKNSWKASIQGGIVTSILFSIGKVLIGLYLGHAAFESVYGAAGSLMALYVWSYYSSLTVLLGAEVSAFYFEPKADETSAPASS